MRRSRKNMIRANRPPLWLLPAIWSLLALWPLSSSAQLLSHIEVKKENDVGVIHIVFTRPVIYTQHVPPEHGYILHIYFNDLTLERGNLGLSMRNATPPMDEFMRSPPNDIVPVFWVAYNNHGTSDLTLDPFHLQVQFGQPVHYKVLPDRDNQGFYIFVLSVDPPPAKKQLKSQDPATDQTENPKQQNPTEQR
jgi:hypothetical protein